MLSNYKYHIWLHITVLIFGLTGILGKLITIDSYLLVWYRLGIAVIGLFLYFKLVGFSLAISKKKIDKLWANAQIVEAQTKITNHSDEWVIKLKNPAENSKQAELYLFFTLDGEFLAMNYTGK